MFRWLRWSLEKRLFAAPAVRLPTAGVWSARVRHRARPEDFPPNEEGYRRLAAVWDDYAGWFVPRYGRFVTAAGDYFGRPARDVLDLACGTGLLTRQLARRAASVVGLDASEDMLREARARTPAAHVRYVRGDFRNFALDETFDAAVCGSDSLNYVAAPGEVADVFRRVRRHLRPGGLFVFDVLDDRAFRVMAGVKIVARVAGEWLEVYYFYDREQRVSEARAITRGAVERHRRVPIESGDVRRAAREAGLEVAEHFTTDRWLFTFVRQFYVLRCR